MCVVCRMAACIPCVRCGCTANSRACRSHVGTSMLLQSAGCQNTSRGRPPLRLSAGRIGRARHLSGKQAPSNRSCEKNQMQQAQNPRAAPITRIEAMMDWTDTPAEDLAPRQRHESQDVPRSPTADLHPCLPPPRTGLLHATQLYKHHTHGRLEGHRRQKPAVNPESISSTAVQWLDKV